MGPTRARWRGDGRCGRHSLECRPAVSSVRCDPKGAAGANARTGRADAGRPAGKPTRLAAANAKRFQVLSGRAADMARGGCLQKQRANAPAPVRVLLEAQPAGNGPVLYPTPARACMHATLGALHPLPLPPLPLGLPCSKCRAHSPVPRRMSSSRPRTDRSARSAVASDNGSLFPSPSHSDSDSDGSDSDADPLFQSTIPTPPRLLPGVPMSLTPSFTCTSGMSALLWIPCPRVQR